MSEAIYTDDDLRLVRTSTNDQIIFEEQGTDSLGERYWKRIGSLLVSPAETPVFKTDLGEHEAPRLLYLLIEKLIAK